MKLKQILWQMMFNSLDIIRQIIYICDFVNKIKNAQIYVWMYKKNKVKFTNQMNAEWLTQNWLRLVFDTMSLRWISPLALFNDALSLSDLCLPRYNNQQHTEKALQFMCTTNKNVCVSLSLMTLINEWKN